MRRPAPLVLGLACLVVAAAGVGADVRVSVDRNVGSRATDAFRFDSVPSPAGKRGGARAVISVIDGTPNDGCRGAIYLGKDRRPEGEDDPKDNFFFAEGSDGGRLRIDLEGRVAVRQVNTYSWHPSSRGPQVYVLYGADGAAAGFDPAPKKGTDPATCGWTRLASVDTRTVGGGTPGGQYGVSVADPAAPLGTFRYLLLDVSRTESADDFGNTFFSKIDVIADRPTTMPAEPTTRP